MSWLRVDDGFTSNSKVAQLTDREFRVWVRVLCHCGKSQDPTVDAATVAEVSGLTNKIVGRLAGLLLIDVVGDVWEVHDWHQYQPKDATGADRQARWRARKRLSDVTGTVTPTVTPDVTETVTETLPRARAGAGDRPVPSPEPVKSSRPVGLDSEQNLVLTAAEVLAASIREADRDDGTRTVIVAYAQELVEDDFKEVLRALKESRLEGGVRNEARWVNGALKKRAMARSAA